MGIKPAALKSVHAESADLLTSRLFLEARVKPQDEQQSDCDVIVFLLSESLQLLYDVCILNKAFLSSKITPI